LNFQDFCSDVESQFLKFCEALFQFLGLVAFTDNGHTGQNGQFSWTTIVRQTNSLSVSQLFCPPKQHLVRENYLLSAKTTSCQNFNVNIKTKIVEGIVKKLSNNSKIK
jgi:hypothetical protein